MTVRIRSPTTEKRGRGRQRRFTPAQLEQARQMKLSRKPNNEIARRLYKTNTPSESQRRSVSTTLKHRFGPKKDSKPSKK